MTSASAAFFLDRLMGETCFSSSRVAKGPGASSGEMGRSFLDAARGRRARLASALRLTVPVRRTGFSESDSMVFCERADRSADEEDDEFTSFRVAVAATGACLVFATRKVACGTSSDATLMGSDVDLAVSSLIVRAPLRTVPVLASRDAGRDGGGMRSASLAGLRSATAGRVVATSLCESSLSPRMGACTSSTATSASLAFGLFQSLTVEM